MPKYPSDPKRSKDARNTARRLWTLMRTNQRLFTHPKTEPLPQKQWDTVAWNAAWMAAEAADGAI